MIESLRAIEPKAEKLGDEEELLCMIRGQHLFAREAYHCEYCLIVFNTKNKNMNSDEVIE